MLNQYHLYVVSVASNGDVTLYVDGNLINTVNANNNSITEFVLNAIKFNGNYTNDTGTKNISYKYIALANTNHSATIIGLNSTDIMGQFGIS